MYLLDTNVVSELGRAANGRADQNAIAWDSSTPPESKYLSVITVMELETGVLRAARRDPAQAKYYRQWLENSVLPAFRGRIFDVTEPIARRCAALHVPDPKSDLDSLLAATALVYDMTVVTRNVRDFERTGVRILNPWLPL